MDAEKARTEAEKERAKRRDREKVRYLNAQLAKIDLTKLERDNRNPSGFKNVYATPTGYRAQVCRDGRARYLPTRAEPVLAAQDRYEWHVKYGIPYGEEAKRLEQMKKQLPGSPDELLALQRVRDAWIAGTGPSLTDDRAYEAELQNIRMARALAEAEDKKKRGRGRPHKVIDVWARRSGKITWIGDIANGHRVVVEHVDGTALSYMPIARLARGLFDDVEAGEKLGEVDGARIKISVQEVDPPSKLRAVNTPVPSEDSFLAIPTAAERAVSPPELPEPDPMKEQLKALIRQQKQAAVMTPTERISDEIEKQTTVINSTSELAEDRVYETVTGEALAEMFTGEDLAEEIVAGQEAASTPPPPTPTPFLAFSRTQIAQPTPPPRPAPAPTTDEDDFWNEG